VGRLGGAVVSYLSGILLIFIVMIAGVFGLIMIFSHTDMTGPIDSGGLIPNNSENLTRTTVVTYTPTITTLAGWIAFIVGVMVVISIILYLVASNKGNGRSRY
jgi:hypothetical protein